MSDEILKLIGDTLESIGINFAFMEWKDTIVYPYFIGEIQEQEPDEESGEQEAVLVITGTTRGTYKELKNKCEAIKNALLIRTILGNLSGVVISYTGSRFIPTGDMELKRIELNFNITEWSVN